MTAIATEVDRFDSLAATWWDSAGPMRPLRAAARHASLAPLRPTRLHRSADAAGPALIDLRGLRYLPLLHRVSWARDSSVNYIAAYWRPVQAAHAALSATDR